MALQVPIYDAPQVQATPIQTPQAQVAPNGLADLGKHLEAAAGHVFSVEQHAQYQADQQTIVDKSKVLQDKINEWGKIQMSLQGKDLMDPSKYDPDYDPNNPGAVKRSFTDVRAEDIQKTYDALIQGMAPHLLKGFSRHAEPLIASTGQGAWEHEFKQINTVKDDDTMALVASQATTASLAVAKDGTFNASQFQFAKDAAAYYAGQLADRRGYTGPMRDEFLKKIQSPVVAAAHSALLDAGNSQAALKLAEDSATEVTPSLHADMMAKAGAVNDQNLGMDSANGTILVVTDPTTKTINITEGRKKIQEILRDNPKARAIALQEFEHQAEVQDRDWAKLDGAKLQPVVDDLINGRGGRQELINRVLKSDVGVKARKDGVQSINAWFDDREARYRASLQPLPLTPAQQVAAYATYHKFLDDPASLIGMTDLQIATQTAVLGPDLTRSLMDLKRKAAGSLESLKAESLKDIPFKDIASEYGLKVKGNLTPEDNAKLGMLRDQTLQAIQAEQRTGGKPIDSIRKEEILRGLLVKSVGTRNWWNPMFISDHSPSDTGAPIYTFGTGPGSLQKLDATPEEKGEAVRMLLQANPEANLSPANVNQMILAIRNKVKK